MSEPDEPFQPSPGYSLRPLTLADKPAFETSAAHLREPLSDYTFSASWIWRDAIHISWADLAGMFCVFANGQEGLTLLLPPMGLGDPTPAIAQAREIAAAYNTDHGLGGAFRIEYVNDELLPALARNADVAVMSGDYVYATSRLIDLAGGDLASKRQDRNRFERRFAPRTERLAPHHVPACLALMEQWAQQHVEAEPAISAVAVKRQREQQAAAEALLHADALGLTGMVVFVDDRLAAFTLGETLGTDACSILIEKADRGYKGSAQYVYNEFCRQYWAHTAWTNAGDDWDVPSLVWTKESYRPAKRLAKWMVFPHVPTPVAVGIAPQTQTHLGAHAATVPAEMCDIVARADLGDLADIGALEDRTFEPGLTLRPRLRYLLRCPRASFHVLRHEGQLVASAAVLRRRTKRGLLGRLYSLAVDGASRGRGHGRAVLKDALDTLRREGATACVLEVEASNLAAVGLYESEGFVKTAELLNYYGPARHAWKMRMKLPAGDVATGSEAIPAAAAAALTT